RGADGLPGDGRLPSRCGRPGPLVVIGAGGDAAAPAVGRHGFRPLPGRMRREVTWCVFRVIELGGRIQVHGAAMLARRLTEITAGMGAGGPRSLTDLTARA